MTKSHNSKAQNVKQQTVQSIYRPVVISRTAPATLPASKTHSTPQMTQNDKNSPNVHSTMKSSNFFLKKRPTMQGTLHKVSNLPKSDSKFTHTHTKTHHRFSIQTLLHKILRLEPRQHLDYPISHCDHTRVVQQFLPQAFKIQKE